MKKIYRNDLILNILIILLCISVPICLFVFENDEEKRVIVSSEGCEVYDMPIDKNGQAEINGVTVIVENGRVRVGKSDCPDRLCMKMKDAQNVGDSIICVPNKVSVRIVGMGAKKGADVVAG